MKHAVRLLVVIACLLSGFRASVIVTENEATLSTQQ